MNGLVLLFSVLYLSIAIFAFVMLDNLVFKKMYRAYVNFDEVTCQPLSLKKMIVASALILIACMFFIYYRQQLLEHVTAEQLFEYTIGFFAALLIRVMSRFLTHICFYRSIVQGISGVQKMNTSQFRLLENALSLPLAFAVSLIAVGYVYADFLIGMSFGFGVALFAFIIQAII